MIPAAPTPPRLDNQPVFALKRQAKVLTIWEFITKSLGALPFVRVTAVATLVARKSAVGATDAHRVKRHGASRHLM